MAVTATVTPAGLAKAILESNGRYAVNSTGSTIVLGAVTAWTTTGFLELGEADAMTGDTFAGVAYQDIPDATAGLVVRFGKIPGVLAGLSPIAGQPVYLSTTPGQMTLDISGLDPIDAISRIGFAAPPDGGSGTAVDLVVDYQLIMPYDAAQPSGKILAPQGTKTVDVVFTSPITAPYIPVCTWQTPSTRSPSISQS